VTQLVGWPPTEAELAEKISSLKRSSFAEGDHGILLRHDERVVVKYYKFGHRPNEYQRLRQAHAIGLRVPRPLREHPAHCCLSLERIGGSDLREWFRRGVHFDSAAVDAVESAARNFNRHFTHGDLSPQNVMLCVPDPPGHAPSAGWRPGEVVTEGAVTLVDLVTCRPGRSDEWRDVRRWFDGKIAAPAGTLKRIERRAMNGDG
jgi:hypothetical protein